ncbi:phospholipase C [Lachnospiraceae bacterium]|nr:phospholipase C [Lachnospiraceae bacterium]
MKRLIINVVLSVILVYCMSINVLADVGPTDMSLSQRVFDIANGSDNILGKGVLLSHEENANARFKSGGVDHTHQYILASALIILNNDKGSSILTNKNYSENLLINTDWPDELGNETDYGTFAGHFYDPDTKDNWLGQTSPTAKTRAINYFNSAVSAYESGNISQAIVFLGRGTHYIADINEPHHASNYTALNSNHTEFEKFVDDNRALYKIENNSLNMGFYVEATNTKLDTLIDEMAHESKALYPKAMNANMYDEAASLCINNAIVRVTQYLYKFATTTGIY